MGTHTWRRISLPALGWPQLAALLLIGLLGWTQASAGASAAGLDFAAGSFSMAATHARTGLPFESAPIFAASAMAPGQPVVEAVQVRNDGQIPFSVRLKASGAAGERSTLLGGEHGLQAQVQRADGTIVFRGPLLGLDAPVLERLGAQQEEELRISVWLPLEAGNAAMGGSASLGLSLQAEQVI